VKKFKSRIVNSFFDVLELILVGCILFGIVNIFLGQLLSITGDSMLPTFANGEQIIAEKASLKFTKLQRGEIVIFKHPHVPDRLVIKRVIGLPEEILKISRNQIYTDNTLLKENYLYKQNSTKGQDVIKEGVPFKIPKNSYVLMGDNRDKSADSREWGVIKEEDIIGRTLLVYYPFKNIRIVTN
jgi:signal peptidase I